MISKLVPICPTCGNDMKPSRDHLNDAFASGLHSLTGNASGCISVASGISLSAGTTYEDQLADSHSDNVLSSESSITPDDSHTRILGFKCLQCGMEISVRITS
jgi:predicted RNA-binding Zn-ribbon protein involved in translation (DUF1610 family)